MPPPSPTCLSSLFYYRERLGQGVKSYVLSVVGNKIILSGKGWKLYKFVDLQTCRQYVYWERIFPYSIALRLSPCGLGHSSDGETTVGGQKRRGEKRKVGQIGFGFFNVWEKSVFSARIFRSRNIIRRALPRAIFVCFGTIKSANILVQSPGENLRGYIAAS